MRNLMARLAGRNGIFISACIAVMLGFQLALAAMVASLDIEQALSQVVALAPPLLRAMIEQYLVGGSPGGVLAFGWNHPVAHALLSAVAIALAARAVAGEVESGAIELVLAQPISRARYFAAHVLFGALALAAVIGAGVLGTALGQWIFELEPFPAGRLAVLFANALLLQAAIYAVTLLASAFGREAGRVALIGVLAAVLSFLVNTLATLWSRAAFAKPYSLHGYFDPREILVERGASATSLLVLAAVTAAAIAVGYWRFCRRDLP